MYKNVAKSEQKRSLTFGEWCYMTHDTLCASEEAMCTTLLPARPFNPHESSYRTQDREQDSGMASVFVIFL